MKKKSLKSVIVTAMCTFCLCTGIAQGGEVISPDYLDMNTVIGFETTESGILLLTNDGQGYFIEF